MAMGSCSCAFRTSIWERDLPTQATDDESSSSLPMKSGILTVSKMSRVAPLTNQRYKRGLNHTRKILFRSPLKIGKTTKPTPSSFETTNFENSRLISSQTSLLRDEATTRKSTPRGSAVALKMLSRKSLPISSKFDFSKCDFFYYFFACIVWINSFLATRIKTWFRFFL